MRTKLKLNKVFKKHMKYWYVFNKYNLFRKKRKWYYQFYKYGDDSILSIFIYIGLLTTMCVNKCLILIVVCRNAD